MKVVVVHLQDKKEKSNAMREKHCPAVYAASAFILRKRLEPFVKQPRPRLDGNQAWIAKSQSFRPVPQATACAGNCSFERSGLLIIVLQTRVETSLRYGTYQMMCDALGTDTEIAIRQERHGAFGSQRDW